MNAAGLHPALRLAAASAPPSLHVGARLWRRALATSAADPPAPDVRRDVEGIGGFSSRRSGEDAGTCEERDFHTELKSVADRLNEEENEMEPLHRILEKFSGSEHPEQNLTAQVHDELKLDFNSLWRKYVHVWCNAKQPEWLHRSYMRRKDRKTSRELMLYKGTSRVKWAKYEVTQRLLTCDYAHVHESCEKLLPAAVKEADIALIHKHRKEKDELEAAHKKEELESNSWRPSETEKKKPEKNLEMNIRHLQEKAQLKRVQATERKQINKRSPVGDSQTMWKAEVRIDDFIAHPSVVLPGRDDGAAADRCTLIREGRGTSKRAAKRAAWAALLDEGGVPPSYLGALRGLPPPELSATPKMRRVCGALKQKRNERGAAELAGGRHSPAAAALPYCNPLMGKMLVAASLFQRVGFNCVDPILTIFAVHSSSRQGRTADSEEDSDSEPSYAPWVQDADPDIDGPGSKHWAPLRQIKRGSYLSQWQDHETSDHLATVRFFDEWRRRSFDRVVEEEEFLDENKLDGTQLLKIEYERQRIATALAQNLGVDVDVASAPQEISEPDAALIRALLCVCLRCEPGTGDHIGLLLRHRYQSGNSRRTRWRIRTKDSGGPGQKPAHYIHGSSTMGGDKYGAASNHGGFVVFSHTVRWYRKYAKCVRDVTPVDSTCLALLGGRRAALSKTSRGRASVVIDNWLVLPAADADTADAYLTLRRSFDEVLRSHVVGTPGGEELLGAGIGETVRAVAAAITGKEQGQHPTADARRETAAERTHLGVFGSDERQICERISQMGERVRTAHARGDYEVGRLDLAGRRLKITAELHGVPAAAVEKAWNDGIERARADWRQVTGGLEAGARVSISTDFMSDDQKRVLLPKGMEGSIKRFDGDGDAVVYFAGHEKARWVKARKLHNLVLLSSGDRPAAGRPAASS